jgi:hypothetical protein
MDNFEDHVRRVPWQEGETPDEHAALWPPPGMDPNGKRKPKKRQDKLMGEANKIKGQLMKWVREDEKAKAWAAIHAVIMSFTCMAFFATMMIMWFHVFHNSMGWSIFILVLCLLAATGLIVFGAKKRSERMWIMIMGFLCLIVIFFAAIWGFTMYYHHIVYYERYMEMRSYSNVGGSQKSDGFNDGSMFLFTQDTRLDVMRSVGFKSKWTGETYCVAPVVDSTMSAANPVNWWAVGSNCCLARGEFVCDDAEDPQTMSALVVLEPEDVVRDYMKWAVAGASYPRYIRAIHLEEAAFATRAAKNIKLLYWVKDPIQKQNQFWDDAKYNTIWCGVILWVFLLFLGYYICYSVRWVKPRADKRLQGHATPLAHRQSGTQK